jgi:hypothetical protein
VGWFARRLPAGGDQGVELRAHQIVVAEHKVHEDLGLVGYLLLGRCHRSHLIDNLPRRAG